MDDVQLVKRFAEDRFPPERATAERARARGLDRLQETMQRGRTPIRRRRGLPITVAATVVAALAVVAILLVPEALRRPELSPTTPEPTTARPTTPPTMLTARELLLKAAGQAGANAHQTGRYWNLRMVDVLDQEIMQKEFWLDPRAPGTSRIAGLGGVNSQEGSMFQLDTNIPAIGPRGSLTVLQLLELQDDPAGLKQAIDALWAGQTESPGKVSEEEYFVTLVKLLTTVPVTPEVRAEALRMLAGLPRIRTAGEATDYLGRTGVVVTLAKDEDGFDEWDYNLLTIDPNTFEVLSAKSDAPRDDPTTPYYVRWTMVVEAEWTDDEPQIPAALPVRIR